MPWRGFAMFCLLIKAWDFLLVVVKQQWNFNKCLEAHLLVLAEFSDHLALTVVSLHDQTPASLYTSLSFCINSASASCCFTSHSKNDPEPDEFVPCSASNECEVTVQSCSILVRVFLCTYFREITDLTPSEEDTSVLQYAAWGPQGNQLVRMNPPSIFVYFSIASLLKMNF